MIKTKDAPEGELISHSYTPISSPDRRGTVQFSIKIYRRGFNPKFPDGGRLTQHLESLKLGDPVRVI